MKILTHFMRGISGSLGMLFFLAPLTVFAQTKVVVIPLFGDDMKPLKNIITVAKANGNFTSPVAAVNSIGDASEENPYLVVIAPGVYTISQTLEMKEYVDIVGSGENVTKLTGAISTGSRESSAIISGANNSTVSSLTVENMGGSDHSIGLYNYSASPTLTNVTATASGGTYNYGVCNVYSSPMMRGVPATATGGTSSYGVYNHSSSSPTMTDITATASGWTNSNGVYNYYSSPTMVNVTATASGGTSSTPMGVYNLHSSPMMRGVTATASGGTYNYGVGNYSSSSPTMTDITATATGGTYGTGVINSSSSPEIRRSTMKGNNQSLSSWNDSTTTVSQSTLLGAVGGVGNMCVACDDGNGNALGADCH